MRPNDFVNFQRVSAVLNSWLPVEDLPWKPLSNFLKSPSVHESWGLQGTHCNHYNATSHPCGWQGLTQVGRREGIISGQPRHFYFLVVKHPPLSAPLDQIQETISPGDSPCRSQLAVCIFTIRHCFNAWTKLQLWFLNENVKAQYRNLLHMQMHL